MPRLITLEELDKLQALRDAATSGDVHLEGCIAPHGDKRGYCEMVLDGFEHTPLIAGVQWLETGQANANYMVAAWNTMPRLVAELRRLLTNVEHCNAEAENRFP